MDALFNELGIDESAVIDPTEIARIKRVLDGIKLVAAGVAKRYDTDDTVVVLDAMYQNTKLTAETLTPADARKFLASFSTGAASALLLDPNAETNQVNAQKAAELDQVKEELEKLQEAATKKPTKALGAGDSGDKLDEMREALESLGTGAVDFVYKLVQKLSTLPADEMTERSILAGHVINGTDGWAFEDKNGVRKPHKVHVAEDRAKQDQNTIQTLTTERDNANTAKTAAETAKATAEKELKDQKSEAVKDSLAQKLKIANDKLAATPTDTVSKAAVEAEVKKAKTELNRITVKGIGKLQNLDEAKKALNEVHILVKP